MVESTVYVLDGDGEGPNALREILAPTGLRVEFYTSCVDFLSKLDVSRPACLLLDLALKDMHGLEVQSVLKNRGIELPTIIVTTSTDVGTAVEAMQRGALDVFEKPVRRQELLRRIEEALRRDRKRREAEASRAELDTRWNRLTPGERAVTRMLCDGKSSREIGAILELGRRTIENRRANIMVKMGAKSLAHLVRVICGAGDGFPPSEPTPPGTLPSESQ